MENENTETQPTPEEKPKEKKSWSRVLYMILFVIIGKFITAIVVCVALFQFIYSLVFKEPNQKLLPFMDKLGLYAKEIIDYLAYNSEEKPWPIGDYPQK